MTSPFPPRAPSMAAIFGSTDTFPIGRIYCVGRNYVAHAREMGKDPEREPPFFFLKDSDALAMDGAVLPYPPQTSEYHHEIELVVAIGAPGFEIAADQAQTMIYGYAVGLDMTRRDLQLAARESGRPWDTGKNFPMSAPMGPIYPVSGTQFLLEGLISLRVNGVVRQEANLKDMIWNVNEVIEHISKFYHLVPGDLIFTGTPAGVAAVSIGDVLEGSIEGLGQLAVTIGAAERQGQRPKNYCPGSCRHGCGAQVAQT